MSRQTLKFADRRSHLRFAPQGLAVKINDEIHALIDISIGGLSFEGYGFTRGQQIEVWLTEILDDKSIAARVEVVDARDGRVCGKFSTVTAPLATFVLHNLSLVLGVPPYILTQ